MFKHYFEIIDGIDIYPIISLLIFFIFFVLLFIWVIRVDKQYIKDMEELPLDHKQPNYESNEVY